MTTPPRNLPGGLPAAALGLALALGLVHWWLDPGGTADAPDGVLVLIALWGWVELVIRSDGPRPRAAAAIHRWHRITFAVLGLYNATFFTLALATDFGLFSDAAVPLVRRGFMVLTGLLLAAWGNRLPTLLSPWRSAEEPFDWQGVHRVVGWLAAVGGIVVALLWITLSQAEAERMTRVVLLTVFGCALGVKLLSALTHRRGGSGAHP